MNRHLKELALSDEERRLILGLRKLTEGQRQTTMGMVATLARMDDAPRNPQPARETA